MRASCGNHTEGDLRHALGPYRNVIVVSRVRVPVPLQVILTVTRVVNSGNGGWHTVAVSKFVKRFASNMPTFEYPALVSGVSSSEGNARIL